MNAQPSFLSPYRLESDNAARMTYDPPSRRLVPVRGALQSSPRDIAANGDAVFRQAAEAFQRGDQKHGRDLTARALALWKRAGVV